MTSLQSIKNILKDELDFKQLPPFLNQIVDCFSKVHIYYRTYKHIKYYNQAVQNPSKGQPAVYGALLQCLGDYTHIGSYAINVALVTKCAEDLLREYRKLNREYQKLSCAVNCQYPLYHRISSTKEKKKPSTYPLSWNYLCHVQMMNFARQILKIIRYATLVFIQCLKISMCIYDAHLLLNGDTQARFDACTELIAEWDVYRKQLMMDQKHLIGEIQKGCLLANRILTRLGIQKDCSFISENLKLKITTFTDTAKNVLDDLYEAGKDTVDSFYVPGKITPLSIDFTPSQSTANPPQIPNQQFPPWSGQEVTLIPEDKMKQMPEIMIGREKFSCRDEILEKKTNILQILA